MLKTKIVLILVLLLSLSVQLAAAQSQDSMAILEKVDVARQPWSSVRVDVSIEEFRDSQLVSHKDYQVLYPTRGRSLVRFMDPAEQGQMLLMRSEGMWIYFPRTRRALRITPIQRLSGNASNGDLAKLTFGEDYDARILPPAAPDTPDTTLELTARTDKATYARIVLVVGADGLAKRADYFLASGKHMKTVEFSEYREFNGATVLSRMVLRDPRRSDQFTVMHYKKFTEETFPDRYFQRAYLPNLRFTD